MTRYQLVKLVEWAGKLKTRKRLQKVTYLLQAAGCPWSDQFRLHHFGPYSADVAQRADELTGLGLLQEECVGNAAGQQYNYNLTEDAKGRLASLEATQEGQAWARELAPFEERASRILLNSDVRELEVAATMVFFRQQGYEWSEAVERTCIFKNLKLQDGLVGRARKQQRAGFAASR